MVGADPQPGHLGEFRAQTLSVRDRFERLGRAVWPILPTCEDRTNEMLAGRSARWLLTGSLLAGLLLAVLTIHRAVARSASC
jgi:hypothetical protein